jgi:hypothetical protein
MKTIIVENNWLSREGQFAMDYGWGNGYVLIPRDHCLWGVYYDDIPVEVHGGLTFNDLIEEEILENKNFSSITKEDIGSWMVGFDTCHSGDTLEKWSKEAVQAETDRLAKQLGAITSFTLPESDLIEEDF